MLYDGRKDERSGYVRVPARPATAEGSKPRCQSTTAWPSTSMPRRPARPVSWVYSPGVMSACVSPFHLTSFSRTTERAGMLMPERQGLGGEDRLDQALDEQFLDDLLERREHAGVVGGDAALQALQPLEVAEDVQVLVGDGAGALLDDGAHPQPALVGVEPQARVQALLDGGLAAGPAEDEGDGGQQALAVEPVDDLGAAGRPDPAAGPALALPVGLADALGARVVAALVLHPGQAFQVGVDLAAAALVGGGAGPLLEQVVHPAAGQHVLPQRYRPVLGDDHPGVAADGVEPVAELLGVGDGRGQRHQGHRRREVDDHLLPDRAAEAVGEVVHLVHHHVAEAVEGGGARVEHVPQDLGGHHDHRGVAVDAVVAGEQADLVGAVALGQVVVLLVGEGLDRRGVEALAALGEGQVDGELADDGLARAGRGGDEDAAAVLQRLACLDLEGVEAELVQLAELCECGGVLCGAATAGGVALGGRHLIGHLVHEPTRGH